jgi:chemotaxis regulatin CheY-phosphate phosphatase CheZ
MKGHFSKYNQKLAPEIQKQNNTLISIVLSMQNQRLTKQVVVMYWEERVDDIKVKILMVEYDNAVDDQIVDVQDKQMMENLYSVDTEENDDPIKSSLSQNKIKSIKYQIA